GRVIVRGQRFAAPVGLGLALWAASRGVARPGPGEARFERMFDISQDLLCVVGADGSLQRVNPALERMLGYTAAELLTMSMAQLVHPDDLAGAQDALVRLAGGQETVEFAGRVIRADG